MSRDEALQLAVTQANDKAKRLYRIEPFAADDGELTRKHGGWLWEALTSVDKVDVTARVFLPGTGAGATVNVEMISHPDPRAPPRLPDIRRPRHDIPESIEK